MQSVALSKPDGYILGFFDGQRHVKTFVYETEYHWFRNFLSDAGFHTEGVAI